MMNLLAQHPTRLFPSSLNWVVCMSGSSTIAVDMGGSDSVSVGGVSLQSTAAVTVVVKRCATLTQEAECEDMR